MTTLEPEQKDILEKLNEIALEANWGTVDRVDSVPKAVAVIQEAMEEIKDLRKRIVFWRNDTKADEQIRKETAKEIFNRLENAKQVCIGNVNYGRHKEKNNAQIGILTMIQEMLIRDFCVILAEKNS